MISVFSVDDTEQCRIYLLSSVWPLLRGAQLLSAVPALHYL